MKSTIALPAFLFLVWGSMWVLADDKPTTLSDARAAVEANLRTPEGKAYDQQLGKEFPQKYLDTMKQCKQSAGNDLADFWMLIKLDKSGAVKEVLLSPATKMAACARETLLKGSFSPPPRSAYWASIYMKLAH
jgi:hypothetical protein